MPADPETGLAERLTDPASGPPPPPRVGVVAYARGEQAPGAPFDLAVAARRLGQGDPVGAFEAIEGPLLHRAAPLDPAEARSAALLVRRSVHPGYNPFLIPLGAVFTALGAVGLLGSGVALGFDSISFGGSPTVEPVPYVFAFTAAGLSLVGGVLTLISSLFVNRGGEVGVYQERRRAVLMRLREDRR